MKFSCHLCVTEYSTNAQLASSCHFQMFEKECKKTLNM